MADLLYPHYFKLFVEVAEKIGGLDQIKKRMDAPNSALACKRISNNAIDSYKSWCYQNMGFGDTHNPKLEEKLKQAERFQHVLKDRFPKLLKPTIAETETDRLDVKGLPELPSVKDIKSYMIFLSDAQDAALGKFDKKVTYDNYVILAETMFLLLQLFNRRRTSETENLKIDVFEKGYEKFSIETHFEYFKNLTSEGKKQVNKFGVLYTRGKQNKKRVGVLINEKNYRALTKLTNKEHRKIFNIPESNRLIFGLRGDSSEVREFVKGYFANLKWLNRAKHVLDHPDLIRSRFTRIAVATLGLLLNLGADAIKGLSNFLGHDYQTIHKRYYELPLPLREIIDTSRTLEIAAGMDDEDDLNETDKTNAAPKDDVIEKINAAPSAEPDIEQSEGDSYSTSSHENSGITEFLTSCTNAENSPCKLKLINFP